MSLRLAHNFDEQCLQGKFFGRYGKNGGTFRCQLKKNHEGNHIDCFGRSWPRLKLGLREPAPPAARSATGDCGDPECNCGSKGRDR